MSLTQPELTQFHRKGFLLKPGQFGADDLEPLRNALTEIIDQQARMLLVDGQLTQLYEEEPFGLRLARIHAESKEAGGQITLQIMGKGGGGCNGPAMLHCIRHAPLLSCIESLVGPDIVGSSVYRIRPKLPGWGRGEVPWHQDAGYTLAHCDRHLIVTCWVPLVDATLENGCLHVIPTVHRGGILRHFTGGHAGFLEVPQDQLPAVEPIPIPKVAGDVLLLTNLTPHASFPTERTKCAGASTCAIRARRSLTTSMNTRRPIRRNAIPSPWPAIRPKPISSFGTGTIQREKSALPRSSKRCGNGMRAAAPLHRDGAGRRCGSGNVQSH